MNILEIHLPKWKQGLPAILFMSTIHIWWCFNFPAYIRLGGQHSNILGIGMSILGFALYSFIFSQPEKIVSCLKFEQIDTELWGPLKYVMRIFLSVFLSILLLVAWYKDFYRMPSIYYVLLYIYYLTFFVLLFRAAQRSPVLDK